jgi:hypothetical protein
LGTAVDAHVLAAQPGSGEKLPSVPHVVTKKATVSSYPGMHITVTSSVVTPLMDPASLWSTELGTAVDAHVLAAQPGSGEKLPSVPHVVTKEAPPASYPGLHSTVTVSVVAP